MRRDGPLAIAGPAGVSTPGAIAALVVVNLVPLVGVVGFGWSAFDLMLLYWFESGVVGLFALLTIVLSRGALGPLRGPLALLARLLVAALFLLHYGGFWAGHGALVFLVFGGDGGSLTGPARGDLPLAGTLLAALGLLWSHAVSFVHNVLQRGEGLDRSPFALMLRPYGRVLVLHFALVLGVLVVLAVGESVWALVLFVLLKIGLDLAAHLRSHRPAAR